jgi:hypothetical protein
MIGIINSGKSPKEAMATNEFTYLKKKFARFVELNISGVELNPVRNPYFQPSITCPQPMLFAPDQDVSGETSENIKEQATNTKYRINGVEYYCGNEGGVRSYEGALRRETSPLWRKAMEKMHEMGIQPATDSPLYPTRQSRRR